MTTYDTTDKDVVLIVDDMPETLSMLNDTLDEAGLKVLVALEGEQALMIAENIVPDVILLDAIMPNMDGFETCRRLKENPDLAHIPVIFMTGLSDTESVLKGFEAGGVDYLTKPIIADQLIARIKAHLSNSRLTSSAYAALDSAGQYLISSNIKGEFLWGTPMAHQLFHQTGANANWLDTELSVYVTTILDERYNKEKELTLQTPKKELELKYIGQTGNDEFLLRIIDPERPNEVDLLKEKFKVTTREAEVLLWISKGKTNREIGTILSMSPRTVNKHLEQVFSKLAVDNRTSAAFSAFKVLMTDLS
jgi:DNA-binding response OmpR family regulator/DNA-binding CsgD family transcriptional regulator|tara:strand:- start:1762 stop:2682 length:921 start_codon:yes stop_codon:yes gene_type:complete